MIGGRRARSRCAAAAALVGVALVGHGCSRGEPPRTDARRPVKSLVVAAGAATEVRLFAGRIVASQEPDLAFQVSGLLSQFPAREGQRLTKGEVIAQLRQDEFEARLASLRGQLDRASASLRALRAGERTEERMRLEAQVRAAAARLQHARVEFERYAELIKENAVARSDYELVETELRVAEENHEVAIQTLNRSATGRDEDIEAMEADVRGLEARVREANIQFTDSTLRAPFDGVVAHRYVEESQNIAAGQPIVRFQNFGSINIAVDVPEAVMAADLRREDIVSLTAEFSAVPGRQFPVEIREVAQLADPVTQTFRVRLAMDAPPGALLLPGMTATVQIEHRSRAAGVGAVRVPITAVYKGSSEAPVVWVIDAQDVVERRPVQLGGAIGGEVLITEGLQPGERIAIAGVSQLSEGMHVRDLGDALSAPSVAPGAARP